MSLFYTNETNTLKNHKEKVGDIMTSLKTANRRVGSFFAVAALVLATITPGLVPAFASAAQLSERSVTVSSSSKEMEDVSYTVEFSTTNAGTTGAVVLQFCSDTPLIGVACAAPAGFNISAATAAGFTPSALDTPANNARVFAGTFAATTVIPVEGVTNPDDAGPLYVRMVTYDTAEHAEAYVATNIGEDAIDQGSAAVSITDTVGVSAAVLETMTFCVSGTAITTEGCASTTSTALELGETSGDVVALSATDVSEASIYSQISTNASSGAVVNLRSNAIDCGGLLLAGDDDCHIGPATAGIDEGDALFGLRVATAANPGDGSNSVGAFQAAGETPYYSDSIFKINFVSGNGSGVTGPYGDPILDTAGAPVSNKNAQITFGASIANNTPAGRYSADFSLIATGKF